MVLGKALTAGYLGHAATLATSEVYNAFLGDSYQKAFMHGPTFMANPLACSVSLKSIEIFQRDNYLEKVNQIESFFIEHFNSFKHPSIEDIRVLGCMLVIQTTDQNVLSGFKAFSIENGVWLRPIGKFLYATPPFIISKPSLIKIIETIKLWFDRKK